MIYFIISISFIKISQATTAGDIKDQIVDTLTALSCETQGIGDLLSSEFSHTCIPAPFATFAVANILSPLNYANTMLRLKINHDELFPGACKRENRIEFNNQELSFALCSNIKLTGMRAVALAKSIVAIAGAMITGNDPWQAIKDSWDIPAKDYHNIYTGREGNSGVMGDIGVPPIVPWKIIKDNDKMCVSTISITGDWLPVGCKYIKEPFPQSIYADFMDLAPSGTPPPATNIRDVMQLTKCSGTNGCFQRAFTNSKTGIVITAPIIECIKEMTARLLVSQDVCSFDDAVAIVGNTAMRNSSIFFQFQKNMHRFVTGFLTLYVVFFGIKLVLGGTPPKSEFFNFIFKIVFVTYFSVGISVGSGGGAADRLDGMLQFVIPTLLTALEQLAGWIMSSSPSGLCVFNISEYPAGFGNIALWDALDCRVSHYLGLDFFRTMIVENAAREHDFANFDFFNFAVPPYYYLLIPAVMSGNMTLVSLALMYPMLVISVGAYLVNSTVVCIIAIVILSLLAPLFVPMLLFNYTKGYFDAWVRLMLSFVLQPMVVVTFMMTMFTVYDVGFYGKCKYTHSEIATGYGTDARRAKIFFLDNDWTNYTKDEDIESCKNSLGYILNNPIAALYDTTKTVVQETVRTGGMTNDTDKHMQQYDFLGSITSSPGMFFTAPKLIWEKIKDLILALITACFTLYLMYHLSAQLAEFAADMTEGVSLSNVSIKPQAIFKKGMAAINAAGKLAAGSKDTGNIGGGGGGSKDTSSVGDSGGSSDTASVGGGGSQDTASIGGGRGSSDTASIGRGTGSRSTFSVEKGNSSAKVDSGTRTGTWDAMSSSGSAPSTNRPYVPMRELSVPEVNTKLDNFFTKNNVNSNNISSYSSNEFSGYIALSTRPNVSEDRKNSLFGTYATMLEKTLSNKEMKGKEAVFTKEIESMLSGTPKEDIASINKNVLNKLGVKDIGPSLDPNLAKPAAENQTNTDSTAKKDSVSPDKSLDNTAKPDAIEKKDNTAKDTPSGNKKIDSATEFKERKDISIKDNPAAGPSDKEDKNGK